MFPRGVCCSLQSDKLISCFKSDLLYNYFWSQILISCFNKTDSLYDFWSQTLISCFKTDLLYSEVRQINFQCFKPGLRHNFWSQTCNWFPVSKRICCILMSDKLNSCFKTDYTVGMTNFWSQTLISCFKTYLLCICWSRTK